jgi:hypothetical protein
LAWEKTGQFLVRTHVRKYQQILKKLRTMSGGLDLAVYVLVYSEGAVNPHAFAAVVDEAHADPAGGYRWRAICRFGEMKGKGIGDSFLVRAAAINPAKIKVGKTTASLVENGYHSNAITLKRFKK